MKNYIVTVKVQTDGLEKMIRVLVGAESEDQADEKAMLSLCHGSVEDGSVSVEDGSVYDMYDTIILTIHDTKQVPDQDLIVLKKYF